MHKFSIWIRIALTLTLLAARAGASEGGARIVLVADSRRATGWESWWMNIYNDSYLAFALLTIIILPLLGWIMGMITDFVMVRIGINLKSRGTAEH
jgi:hypothetical protein